MSHSIVEKQIELFSPALHCCDGNAEIGATAKAPAERTVKHGIAMGYVIFLTAYLFVSVTGGLSAFLALPAHATAAAAASPHCSRVEALTAKLL